MIKDRKEIFDEYFNKLSDKNKELVVGYLTGLKLMYDEELAISEITVHLSNFSLESGVNCCVLWSGNCYCGDIILLDDGELAVFYSNKQKIKAVYKITGYEEEVLNEMLINLERNRIDCDLKVEYMDLLEEL